MPLPLSLSSLFNRLRQTLTTSRRRKRHSTSPADSLEPRCLLSIDGIAPRLVEFRPVSEHPYPTVFSLIFTEPVVGLDTGDFSFRVQSGNVTLQQLDLAGSGAEWTVTAVGLAGRGVFTVDIRPQNGITDAAGNPFIGDVDSGFLESPAARQPRDPYGVVVADFDGDGRDEVIDHSSKVHAAAPLRMIGVDQTGALRTELLPILMGQTQNTINRFFAADFNLDQKSELLLHAFDIFDGRQYLEIVQPGWDGSTTTSGVRTYLGAELSNFDRLSAADFNGDERLDLLLLTSHHDHILNTTSTTIAVLINNGAGGFVQNASFIVNGFFLEYSVADMNRDGRIDLVVSTSESPPHQFPAVDRKIAVWLQNSSGSFTRTFSANSPVFQMTVADINGDQTPDVIGHPKWGIAVIHLGAGAGQLGAAQQLSGIDGVPVVLPDGLDQPRNLIFAGMTADLYVQSPPGTFQPHTSIDLPGSIAQNDLWQPAGLPAFDSGGGVTVFSELNQFDAPSQIFVSDVQVSAEQTLSIRPVIELEGDFHTGMHGDFDGDGTLDAAVLSSPGRSDLAAPEFHFLLLNPSDASETRLKAHLQTSQLSQLTPGRLIAPDLDADGFSDLLYTIPADNRIVIRRNQFGAALSEPLELPVGITPHEPVTADFNRDGLADIAVTNAGSSSVSILLGLPNAQFEKLDDLPVGLAPHGLVVADFNSDLFPDLIVAEHDSSQISLYRGNGLGTFLHHASFPLSSPASQILLADLYQDGLPEIVAVSTTETLLHVLEQTETGFASLPPILLPMQPRHVSFAGFNGDGLHDLVVDAPIDGPSEFTAFSIAIAKGDGLFESPVEFASSPLPGGAFRNSLPIDFNLDGQTDLAVPAAYSNINAFRRNSTGLFDFWQELDAGHASQSMAVGDFNGDRLPDVVTLELWNAAPVILLNAASNAHTNFHSIKANCNRPELDPIPPIVISEGTREYRLNLTGISPGLGESEPLQLYVQSPNPNLIPNPQVLYTQGSTTATVVLRPDQFTTGEFYFELTLTDGGPDGLLNTGIDNSQTFRIITVTLTPTRAIIQAPQGPTELQQQEISWSTVPDAVSWNIWYSNLSTGQNPLFTDSTSATTYRPKIDTGIGLIEVWVQAVKANGSKLPWSRPARYQVNTAVRINPLPLRHPNGLPSLTWPAVPGADSYIVYVANRSSGQSPQIQTTVSTNSWTPPEPLDLSSYRVWARAAIAGKFDARWSTHVDLIVNTAPTAIAPLISSPNTTPTFSWSTVPGAATYGFQLRHVVTGQIVANVQGLTTNSWSPSLPLSFGPYRWWTYATSTHNFRGDWSAPSDLTIGDRPAIIAPFGLIPANSAVVRWLPLANAVSYQIWVSRTAPATELLYLASNLTQTQHSIPTPLPRNTPLRVWIRAVLADGRETLWSPHAQFQIT